MADKPSDKVVTDYEEALEAGYFGTVPDDTPNEAYTVQGVTSSDEAAKADRRAAAGSGNVAPDLVTNPNPQTEKDATKASGATKKSG